MHSAVELACFTACPWEVRKTRPVKGICCQCFATKAEFMPPREKKGSRYSRSGGLPGRRRALKHGTGGLTLEACIELLQILR